MRRLFLLSALAVLTACNTPGLDFQRAVPTRVAVDGSLFDVRVRALRAEAIRVNPEYAPRFGPFRFKAATAMQWVSGCRVVDISGDQAQTTGRLDCGDGPPPARHVPLSLECEPVRGSAIKEIGQVRIDLDCAPA